MWLRGSGRIFFNSCKRTSAIIPFTQTYVRSYVIWNLLDDISPSKSRDLISETLQARNLFKDDPSVENVRKHLKVLSDKKIKPDEKYFENVFQSVIQYGKIQTAIALMSVVLEHINKPNVDCLKPIFLELSKNNNYQTVNKLLEEITSYYDVTDLSPIWEVLVFGFGFAGNRRDTNKYSDLLLSQNKTLTAKIYITIATAYASCEQVDNAKNVLLLAEKAGHKLTAQNSFKFFQVAMQKNIKATFELFLFLTQRGLDIDIKLASLVLPKAVLIGVDPIKILEIMRKKNLSLDCIFLNELLRLTFQRRDAESVDKLLEATNSVEKDEWLYNTIVTGYAALGQQQQAQKYLDLAKQAGYMYNFEL